MIHQKRVIIRVALVHGSHHMFLLGKHILLRGAHQRIGLCRHQRRRHNESHRFTVIRAEIGRKRAVDLSLSQRFQGGCRIRVGNRFKIKMRVGHAVGSILQIILQHAGQLSLFRIECTECQIVVLIADTDRPVGGEPVRFLRREECIGPDPYEILLEHPLVVEPVFILNPAQRSIQIAQKIRAFPVDRKEKVR